MTFDDDKESCSFITCSLQLAAEMYAYVLHRTHLELPHDKSTSCFWSDVDRSIVLLSQKGFFIHWTLLMSTFFKYKFSKKVFQYDNYYQYLLCQNE